MEILFLSQRIPYPPEKGDKVRSFNLLRGLARNHVVRVGSLVDDPDDWRHAEALRDYCAEVFLVPLNRRWATLRSARGLLTGTALTKPFYDDRRLRRWVDRTLAERKPSVAFLFSSAMAQYVVDRPNRPGRVLMDFVDVDSEKWAGYAESRRGIGRWIYRREARHLLAHDTAVAKATDASLFVSKLEADLFCRRAPGAASKVRALGNGVDTTFFAPSSGTTGPSSSLVRDRGLRIVFTGAMDYWPNIEAVTWFADHVFDALRKRRSEALFQIVGLNPDRQVMALALRPGIEVTGRVPDIRPYLDAAAVVVAPMEIARGVQNKVLEAMAMGRPVVVSPQGLEGLSAVPGGDLLCAERASAPFLDAVLAAADPDMGRRLGEAARRYVEQYHSWETSIDALEALLG